MRGPWEFVRLDQYATPAEPASEVVRKGLFGMRLRRRSSRDDPLVQENSLREVPEDLLQRAAARPDWNAAVPALTTALQQWVGTPSPANLIQVLVGPPHSGVAEIASAWAEAHSWRLVPPPTPDQVLAEGGEWFEALDTDDNTPFVMPWLERCYLRHHDGLSVTPRLTARLAEKRTRCLLVCDSWAWAYFRKVFQEEVLFPPPLTLQALDHRRLQAWFRSLASGAEASTIRFLRTDTGKRILTASERDATGTGEEGGRGDPKARGTTDFLQCLAGYSRGIPGVAWGIWRRSLQLASREAEHDVVDQSENAAVFWVKPWSQLELPALRSPCDPCDLLLAHTLLLHGTLSNETLPLVLPRNLTEIVQSLHRFRVCGVADVWQGGWRITPAGYPAVRRALQREGYLTDDF